MRKQHITLVAVFLVMIMALFVAGCGSVQNNGSNSNSNNNQPPTPKISETTKEPVDLTLQLSDLPEGYALKDRAPRVRSDVSEEGLSLGWEKGYIISFLKGDNALTGTVITQSISIYPVENIGEMITPLVSDENTSYESIDTGKIGDKSNAYKLTFHTDFGDISGYAIEFIKKNVYERISIEGSAQDFELLKGLAQKAASKI